MYENIVRYREISNREIGCSPGRRIATLPGRLPNFKSIWTLLWRHNGRDGVLNHQPHDRLHNRLFRRRSKKTSKLRVTGLCAGNSPGIGEFPAQMANNAENISIWWRDYHTLILSISVLPIFNFYWFVSLLFLIDKFRIFFSRFHSFHPLLLIIIGFFL